jgi:hypothetical protein
MVGIWEGSPLFGGFCLWRWPDHGVSPVDFETHLLQSGRVELAARGCLTGRPVFGSGTWLRTEAIVDPDVGLREHVCVVVKTGKPHTSYRTIAGSMWLCFSAPGLCPERVRDQLPDPLRSCGACREVGMDRLLFVACASKPCAYWAHSERHVCTMTCIHYEMQFMAAWRERKGSWSQSRGHTYVLHVHEVSASTILRI